MTSLPVSNPETLKTLAALSAGVDTAASEVSAAREAARECSSRQSELANALAEHDAAKPTADVGDADELSAALAANPAAAKSADWTGRLRKTQAEAERAFADWSGKRTVFDQALAKVSSEIAAAAERVTAAESAHERAWEQFVTAAYSAMLDEFEARWAEFHDSVLGPLDALNNARLLYSSGTVMRGMRRRLSEFSVGIETPFDPPKPYSPYSFEKLYPGDDAGAAAACLVAFRSALAAATAKPRNKAA